MKCHYELLEVARDADDDVIKKAYRKLALKWHPDKNPDKVEECTQYFALLQQAYDVLSDPHERAFYDKHRESILKGGFGNVNYEDNSIDLFPYFTSTCYSGFEGPKSFYKVYSDIFAKLAEEDYESLDDPIANYPSFGNKDSDYATVVGPFYGFWSSFCTVRSFHWLDKFDIRGANRYQSKIIDAENKKFRDAGKAERNEQIRELAAFIRKRDPRVKAYRIELERKNEEAKQKQEENRRNQIKKNQELHGDIEAIMEENNKHFESLLAEHDEESVEEEDDDGAPFCVVCSKAFKTQNALEAHKNSRQHKKQLADLMKHMKEEDKAIFEELETTENTTPVADKKGKKAKRRARKKKAWDEESSASESEQVSEHPIEENDAPALTSEPAQINEDLQTTNNLQDTKVKKRRRADKKNLATDEPNTQNNTENTINDNDCYNMDEDSFEDEAAQKTGKCDKCGEFFESRTKLFQHIRVTGHATLKDMGNGKGKNKKGKKK